MATEILVVKEILNTMSQAGVPKADLNFWKGTVNLDFASCQALASYLRAATSQEIKNLNELLKEKIEVFKAGNAALLTNLINKEIKFILK